MNILVTGGSGYIGGLLIEKYIADPNIKKLICIEIAPQPQRFAGVPKLQWIEADLAGHGWEEKILKDLQLDAVAHCAFKIRNPYGKTKVTEENNIAACRAVFAFAFERAVPRLVYLSSVATYGAKRENIGKLLTEEAPIEERENPYGYQKALSEKLLNEMLTEKKPSTQVFVLRLNSVTGPRGQSLESKFGLITFLRKLLPFVIEANPAWARQFVHEDDVAQIIYTLSTQGLSATGAGAITQGGAQRNPEIFNVAPERFLTAKDIAHILHKKTLRIPAWFVKPLFWIAWNVSLGRIPTRPDSSTGLIYPINVNGSRITRAINFHYTHTAEDALLAKK